MRVKGEPGHQPDDPATADFQKRREEARQKINVMDKDVLQDAPERHGFFNAVYENAGGDPAFVPWADLKAKQQLDQWLEINSGFKYSHALTALDVACGLGDNAEALANAGYRTTAFDLAAEAIEWAKRRFPNSKVDYRTADLFDLPLQWHEAFDLVHECYTLQALPPQMLEKTAGAIASLVKPGGTLLVFTRTRIDGANVDGPPWPLEESTLGWFGHSGFELVGDHRFQNEKNGRSIPHAFMEWRKAAG